ncbi:Transmembrane domain-containing protein [Cedratvirus Zaza IHUMI]|uniref:Transmembrane domain-containing protein n=1 Tax=Cedratvirus Zaza IHUMI TaxID=2126979 RepID=A0A2R8FDW3_9VIRU|nr:Transmembrane domain-containing protein [Cedratvirus Zaza IHUMI]
MKWLILVAVLILIVFGIVGIILYFYLRKQDKSNCFVYSCPEGERCSSDGNCIREGTCSNNSDCPSGSTCNAGICSGTTPPPPPIGGVCSTSADCKIAGQRCVGAVCSSVCSSTADCPGSAACISGACVSRSCVDNRDCPSGEACISSQTSSGKTRKVCIGGQPCTNVCPEGLVCVDGQCKQCGEGNSSMCPNLVCSAQSQCLTCTTGLACPSGRVCDNLTGSCCPANGFDRRCTDSSDCTSDNPHCVKVSGEIGVCKCFLLPTGSRCEDNASCMGGSCKTLAGLTGYKRCTIEECFSGADCYRDKPYCKGVCSTEILGSRCDIGGECDRRGYNCVNEICTTELPQFGNRCEQRCAAGLVCAPDPSIVGSRFRYCQVPGN